MYFNIFIFPFCTHCITFFLYILIVNVTFYILITMTGEVKDLVIICFNCTRFI